MFNQEGGTRQDIDRIIVDSRERGEPEFIETKEGVKIPKLDFSSIFI